ncbi:MAG TPA: nucleoside-diphosphate sugar epimerase/dehydratase [Phototrophicaceae bacterium]|nr:nucleoside-diphosphate sugar epimerase/dehydratase [Phototrophicaceae bacterium]
MILDALISLVAYFVTFTVRLLVFPLDNLSSLTLIVLIALLTPGVLYSLGVYHCLWSRTSGHGITRLAKATAVITVITLAVNVVLVPRPLPLSVVVVSNLLALCGFITIRYRSRLLSGASWRWRAIWYHEFPIATTTRVLIVGAGEAGQTLALRLKHRLPAHNYQVMGFVDDDPSKYNMYVEGCKVFGSRKDIPRVAEEQKIELIVVAIHNISNADFREIFNYCEQTRARIKVVPDVLALMNARNGKVLLRDVQLEDLIGRSASSRHEAVNLTSVMHKTIMVTGAAGSIGSELSRQISSYEPTTLLLLDNNESGLYDLVMELKAKHPDVRFIAVLADITNRRALAEVFTIHQPQVIFHAAAFKHVPMLEDYPAEACRVNIGGTRNLAELACEYNVERFVLVSTDKAIYPTSVMGASKRVCELLLRALSLSCEKAPLFTSVRFGNVLGSRGSVVPLFNQQIENGGPVTITHPDMTRYFMSIPEAVNLIIHAACLTEGGDTFVLKMGEVVRIVDLAERMIRFRGLRPGLDIAIHFTGIRPGEKLHEELYEQTETVVETVHPQIVKARSGEDRYSPEVFFSQLDVLMTQTPPDAKQVLCYLLDLINLDCDEQMDYSVVSLSQQAS